MGCLSVEVMVYLSENTTWPTKSVLAITWPSSYVVKSRFIFLLCLLSIFYGRFVWLFHLVFPSQIVGIR